MKLSKLQVPFLRWVFRQAFLLLRSFYSAPFSFNCAKEALGTFFRCFQELGQKPFSKCCPGNKCAYTASLHTGRWRLAETSLTLAWLSPSRLIAVREGRFSSLSISQKETCVDTAQANKLKLRACWIGVSLTQTRSVHTSPSFWWGPAPLPGSGLCSGNLLVASKEHDKGERRQRVRVQFYLTAPGCPQSLLTSTNPDIRGFGDHVEKSVSCKVLYDCKVVVLLTVLLLQLTPYLLSVSQTRTLC